MPSRYSPDFIDRHLRGNDTHSLVELSQVVHGSAIRSDHLPNYGLPQPAFLLCETLLWFAQSLRSGVWTYFEATPEARQNAMLMALEALGPDGYADAYRQGMVGWQNEEFMATLDAWIESHDEATTHWLHRLALENRALFLQLCS